MCFKEEGIKDKRTCTSHKLTHSVNIECSERRKEPLSMMQDSLVDGCGAKGRAMWAADQRGGSPEAAEEGFDE